MLLCSKEHEHNTPNAGDAGFLLHFHSHHKINLLRFENSYVGLGCGSEDSIFLIPREEFFKILGVLRTVKNEGLDYFIRVEKISG